MRKQLIEIFNQLPSNVEVKVLKFSQTHEFPSKNKFDEYLSKKINMDEHIIQWTSMLNDTMGKKLEENAIVIFSYDRRVKAYGILEKQVKDVKKEKNGVGKETTYNSSLKFKLIEKIEDISLDIIFAKFNKIEGRNLESINCDKNELFDVFKSKVNIDITNESEISFPSGGLAEYSKIKNKPNHYGTSEIGSLKIANGKVAEEYVFEFLSNLGLIVIDVSEDMSVESDLKIIFDNNDNKYLEVKNVQNISEFYLSDTEIYNIKFGTTLLCLTDMEGIWISKRYKNLKKLPVIFLNIEKVRKDCITSYSGKIRIDSIAIMTKGLDDDFKLINNFSLNDISKYITD